MIADNRYYGDTCIIQKNMKTRKHVTVTVIPRHRNSRNSGDPALREEQYEIEATVTVTGNLRSKPGDPTLRGEQ